MFKVSSKGTYYKGTVAMRVNSALETLHHLTSSIAISSEIK